MRTAAITRNTKETQITMSLNLDGRGAAQIDSGCGFLDHMLTLFARHGRFDLSLTCCGDTQVDDHHSVEDIGIVLGQCFREILGEKRGIVRYGSCILPMDEALLLAAVDISGRGLLCCSFEGLKEKVGTFDTELVAEFFTAFTRNADLTLHIKQLAGCNSHHILEGAFKSVAQALAAAAAVDPRFADEIPSTKGVL